MSDLYCLYCHYCNYKRFTDGSDLDDLLIYKRAPVATALPRLDPKTKKLVTKASINLPKQFKCPKCGRLITAKKAKNANNNPGSETGSA